MKSAPNADDGNDDEAADVEYVVHNRFGSEMGRYPTEEEAADEKPPFGYVDTVEVEDNEDEESEAESEEYTFIGDGGVVSEEGGQNAESEPKTNWSLGVHTTAATQTSDFIQNALGELDEEVDGDLRGLLEDASSLIQPDAVNTFECPVCGLNHRHSDRKHDIRSAPGQANGFRVEDVFADEMKWVAYCHCGLNELAMLVDYFGYMTIPVFRDQHEFEGVLELDGGVLKEIVTKWNELEGEAIAPISVEDAVIESGNKFNVPPDLYPEIQTFYVSKWRCIKRAANGAPVPKSVRTGVQERRRRIEEQIATARQDS
jgi:hypothetical protein